MDVVDSKFEFLRNPGPDGLRRLVSGASLALPSWLLFFFCDLKLFAWKVGVGALKICTMNILCQCNFLE